MPAAWFCQAYVPCLVCFTLTVVLGGKKNDHHYTMIEGVHLLGVKLLLLLLLGFEACHLGVKLIDLLLESVLGGSDLFHPRGVGFLLLGKFQWSAERVTWIHSAGDPGNPDLYAERSRYQPDGA